eukprot:TRINITY_DN51490_c0_g1_i1.p1 TRINITY_DN51490_c0_g1~~TRINITY_DN51490_c0_g1_i1.p1  ORF type:complete len:328 (+),score=81.69 TRINITY_DN51490_c0_g1_i1:107-985(+)
MPRQRAGGSCLVEATGPAGAAGGGAMGFFEGGCGRAAPAFNDDAPRSQRQPIERTTRPWKMDFWRRWYDVDTADVTHRLAGALCPWRPRVLSYLRGEEMQPLKGRSARDGVGPLPTIAEIREELSPHPDIFGMIWVSSTLWVAIAVAAGCGGYDEDSAGRGFGVGSALGTAAVTYHFVLLAPLGLYGALRWRKVPVEVGAVLCLYGYGLAPYVAAAPLCAAPVLRAAGALASLWVWLVVFAAGAVSCAAVLAHLWPCMRQHLPPRELVPFAAGAAGAHLLFTLYVCACLSPA